MGVFLCMTRALMLGTVEVFTTPNPLEVLVGVVAAVSNPGGLIAAPVTPASCQRFGSSRTVDLRRPVWLIAATIVIFVAVRDRGDAEARPWYHLWWQGVLLRVGSVRRDGHVALLGVS